MTAKRISQALASTAVALLLAIAGAPGTALAATITVNTTADELNNDGDCSLREAIQAATRTPPWTPARREAATTP